MSVTVIVVPLLVCYAFVGLAGALVVSETWGTRLDTPEARTAASVLAWALWPTLLIAGVARLLFCIPRVVRASPRGIRCFVRGLRDIFQQFRPKRVDLPRATARTAREVAS